MNAEMNFTRNGMNFTCDPENFECKSDAHQGHAGMDELRKMGVLSDKCNCSVYTMLSVAGGVLFAIGTVIYSLIAM